MTENENEEAEMNKILVDIQRKNVKKTTIVNNKVNENAPSELFVHQIIETIEFVLGNFFHKKSLKKKIKNFFLE